MIMKRLNLTRAILLLSFALALPNASATDHGPALPSHEFAPLSPGRVHFSTILDYFKSTANYDSEGGGYEDLPNSGSYSNIQTTADVAFDLNARFRLLGALQISRATSSDGNFERTNFALNEGSVGVLVAPLYSLTSRLYLEGIGTFAVESYDESTDEALTGEGAHNLKAGAKYSLLIGPVELFSTLHVQWYLDDRAKRLPWRVGAQLHLGSFKIHGSVFGFQSIVDDEWTETPNRRAVVLNRVNGGSARYGALNPSLLDSQLGLGWHPYHDIRFEIGATKTLNGENTAEGLGAYLGFSMYWGGDDTDLSERKKSQRQLLRKKLAPEDRFKTKQESYDESLFEDGRPKRAKPKPSVDVDKAIEQTVEELE